MRDPVEISTDYLMPFVSELLEGKQLVRFTVTGNSMMPFLRHGRDSVELERVAFETLKVGDIVLILIQTGEYVLHRIVRINTEFLYMVGDAHTFLEGPYYPNQVIGVVSGFWRNGRRIACDNKIYTVLYRLWMGTREFRRFCLRVANKLKRVFYGNE